MNLFARPIDKLVKPEYVQHVEATLGREMFWNVRLAIVGLLGAMLLYYIMLMMDSGIQRHIIWFSVQFAIGVPILIFYFFGENWIKDTKKRIMFANAQAGTIAAVIGIGFVFQIPEIKNQSIKLTAFSLVIGVTGAAAFTFACNRFTFLFYSVPWLLPIQIYFFTTGDLGSMVLGGMVFPYLGVLTFLCLKDYERRVELIRSELTVLEEKEQVLTASKKLKTSLDLVNELKTQQDGDYYLTSLLLNPLGVNAADEGFNVDVDFFTKQKKNFEFKNHKRSIGGDISIAHTLQFATGPVTVFLNADAMGKSMQGAGGSLVLGAVFQSIIERTRLETNVEPERWLKNIFLELQKVFESFDCSMLVSVYIAVLENNTGKLHYLNAEHPWGVLYRDGKAIFLQNRSYYRKLGTPGLQEDIMIDHIQLKPDDIIILGSDGRDDVALPGHEGNVRVINEDESIFLKHVETADARLQEMYELIAASGEITDDLSLVRVQFKAPREAAAIKEKETASSLLRDAKQRVDAGEAAEAASLLRRAYHSASAGPRALRAALNLAMQIKEYSLASNIAEKALRIQGDDTEVMYLAAFAERRLNHLEKAQHYAEKIRVIDPNPNMMNLNLLADIYSALSEKDKANSILDEILTIDPLNAKARRLREGLA
ncbi:MAG: SpoIIE family protein phosphatase [Spirochaetes bacterium]|nr:SpoIIE family protein phosphatase [Spirochaetota bacterium]